MSQKKIAFYSPLKPVAHPVPSGDRLMARLLVNCLEQAGFCVDIASDLRAFLRDPDNESEAISLREQASYEVERLSAHWTQHGAPSLWFCYHPYFKSPDLIGPEMCQRFEVPYVTAEASHSPRRAQGSWAPAQKTVLKSIDQAAVNICFTERDRVGLRSASPAATLAMLRPFIDTSTFSYNKLSTKALHRDPARLTVVAMMRAGDKMNSYRRLAESLKQLMHEKWTLSVVGDGPLRCDVHSLFNELPAERVQWHGLLEPQDIASLLVRSALYVWPGCGEAYGLAYLEAQAAGVPVIAYDTAGVPEVVAHDTSGILTPEGDDEKYAAAIASLLNNPKRLKALSDNAVARVKRYHSLEFASTTLHGILETHGVI